MLRFPVLAASSASSYLNPGGLNLTGGALTATAAPLRPCPCRRHPQYVSGQPSYSFQGLPLPPSVVEMRIRMSTDRWRAFFLQARPPARPGPSQSERGSFKMLELVNPTTNAGGTVTIQTEVFDADSGGTGGAGFSDIMHNRYWSAAITAGAANFTNTTVRLTEAANTGVHAIGQSATQGGAYDSIGGTVAPPVIGPSSATTSLGFFALGILTGAPTISGIFYRRHRWHVYYIDLSGGRLEYPAHYRAGDFDPTRITLTPVRPSRSRLARTRARVRQTQLRSNPRLVPHQPLAARRPRR